jgi:hypothetical protein
VGVKRFFPKTKQTEQKRKKEEGPAGLRHDRGSQGRARALEVAVARRVSAGAADSSDIIDIIDVG